MRTLDPRDVQRTGTVHPSATAAQPGTTHPHPEAPQRPAATLRAVPDDLPAAPAFRVLGLLQVVGAEQVLVTARRQQVVLALLLLNANRLVTLDGLVAGLWDGDPPATARAQVQTAISALRRLLARAGLGERIHTRGVGYVIEVAPGELDLTVFDELLARGRAALDTADPHRARRAFREALALWRGEPVAGVDGRLVAAHRARIAERRVGAVEECVEAELRLGLHRETLGELTQLVAEHPLRERLVGQLMTALYRADRRVEALAAYRALRAALVTELGLEPSAALRRLHQDVLADRVDHGPSQPAAGAARPVPRMLPARPAGPLAHADRLAALRRQLLADPAPAGARVAVLTGRAGVGTSTLAVAAGHALADDFPDGQLYARLTDRAGRPRDSAEVLEGLLRGLGLAVAEIPPDLGARAALYRSALAGRRVLVVLEDAADEAHLAPLLPGDPRCPLIVTTRCRTLAPAGAARHELAPLDADRGAELLATLPGLTPGPDEDAAARQLVELCGGLPLALAGAAARLAARPHWRLTDLVAGLRAEDTRLDRLGHHGVDVRASLRRTLDQLPAPARRLFARLGLLPPGPFPGWVAQALLGDASGAPAEVLETLVETRLVEATSRARGAVGYRLHPLDRVLARELAHGRETTEERAAALRRVFGGWLALADQAADRRGRPRAPGRARRWPPAAPLTTGAPTTAEEWRDGLLAAAELAEAAQEPGYCWELVLAAAGAPAPARHPADWPAAVERALRGARTAGDPAGEAALSRLLPSRPATSGAEPCAHVLAGRASGRLEPRRPPLGQSALVRKEPTP
ncbi:BTAD domain-containing putative transcriptional regulator [Streptomyces sp. DSM 44915]|uniref:BTAD domain-containing putative transcriptional regulator n=1 Tax=Streptomyces chisholmiae TaxID=3075540 RepID=A0ABU2JT28_9ACTN|nr:BTAD domain-containing putative transcriptional regulator [Streptomyces sp. DSM 44915]MDT0267353.1 BTAD domain-containing putative transcriptional regulator [Streptomyces sp. DSM 44915]